jgi:phosphatidylglycerophosphatase A
LKSAPGPDSLPFGEAFKTSGLVDKIALILSSWFGVGLIPVASGTFGTLAAVPFVAVFKYPGGVSESVFLILLTLLAFWSSHTSQKRLAKDDPSEVVIDEAAGFCVSVFMAPFTFLSLSLGFLFFRFFDILKPFPIGMVDRKVKGGLGIVLDDLIAGVFANICVRITLNLIG